MSKHPEPDKPVYSGELNEARTSNRTFEEAKRACGERLHTHDEFSKECMKRLDQKLREHGLL